MNPALRLRRTTAPSLERVKRGFRSSGRRFWERLDLLAPFDFAAPLPHLWSG